MHHLEPQRRLRREDELQRGGRERADVVVVAAARGVNTALDCERVTQAELLAIECGIDTEGSRNNHNIRPFANATLKLVFASKPPLRIKVMHVSSC